ncbi:hypothetical protein N3K66_006328 [Trichothecium roseum]|uniref:Uncharacterized protein n=1 Tax=Trichothecium roseum TaxID=47278 RepID=A0ACC0UVM9_9HYPO|nr:hypothetical protein N3K66_006328 [Trichothecium roseum]
MKRASAHFEDIDTYGASPTKRHCAIMDPMCQPAEMHHPGLCAPQLMLDQGYQGHLTREDAMTQMSRREHSASCHLRYHQDAASTNTFMPCCQDSNIMAAEANWAASGVCDEHPYESSTASFSPDHSLEFEIQRDMGMVWGGGSGSGSSSGSCSGSEEKGSSVFDSTASSPTFTVPSDCSPPQAPYFVPSWRQNMPPMAGQPLDYGRNHTTQAHHVDPPRVPLPHTAAAVGLLGDQLQENARRQASAILFDSLTTLP